jgi:hypothetical protein
VDAPGNVIVTGYFSGSVDFGGGNLVSAGSDDIFVAKYDAIGVHQWSQRFGDHTDDHGYDCKVDALGYVLVTGSFTGTVDFGGGDLVSAGYGGPFPQSDVFVSKYDASGAHQWSQRFGNTNSDRGYSVAAGDSGSAVVTGDFNGTVDFGGGDLVSAGDSDVFLAKYTGLPASGVTVARPAASLSQNFPNPFNPQTTIVYTVGSKATVTIDIYDVSGRLVTRLDQGELPGGQYMATWAANGVPSGVYFYRLTVGSFRETKKMVLLK